MTTTKSRQDYQKDLRDVSKKAQNNTMRTHTSRNEPRNHNVRKLNK